jgi:AraC-like DNA-binding protein
VIDTIDYIYDHLHQKISLNEIAEHVHLNKTYLCGLFKKETGLTIGDYILKRKIEAAQNMLRYSDYSPVDISNYLGFSSHSHFITVFKKETHMTPRQYRTANYRVHFDTPT